jgi:Tfp pilus assembly protein FimV
MKSIGTRALLPYFFAVTGPVVLSLVIAMPQVARAEGASPATETATAKSLLTYTPRARETLDQVILNTMAGSPLSLDLLRQAYVDHNPQAFFPGKARKIRSGVTLQVPDLKRLMQAALAPEGKESVDKKPMSGSPTGGAEERRHWVRFP